MNFFDEIAEFFFSTFFSKSDELSQLFRSKFSSIPSVPSKTFEHEDDRVRASTRLRPRARLRRFRKLELEQKFHFLRRLVNLTFVCGMEQQQQQEKMRQKDRKGELKSRDDDDERSEPCMSNEQKGLVVVQTVIKSRHPVGKRLRTT